MAKVDEVLDWKHFWRLVDSEHIGHGEWYYIEHGLVMYDFEKLHTEYKLIWSFIVITFALNLLFWGYCCMKRKRGSGSILYTKFKYEQDRYVTDYDIDCMDRDGDLARIEEQSGENCVDCNGDIKDIEEQKYDEYDKLDHDL